MAELGLGIHGEPGVETVPFESAGQICNILLSALFDVTEASQQMVLLLNNLGSTTPLEMQAIMNVIASSDYAPRIAGVIGPGLLMTSLDMHGFSLSTLPADAAYLDALKADCEPSSWPACSAMTPIAVQALPDGLSQARYTASANAAMHASVSYTHLTLPTILLV